MNITLILPADKNDPLRKKDPFMPLSLAILAGSAPEHNYQFTDLLWDDLDIDFNKPADVVGISVRMSSEKKSFEIADEFRKRNVKVIMGGPQASVNPFEAKQHADAVAIGEGEQLWPVILQDIEINALKDFYVCSPKPFQANGSKVYQSDCLPILDNITKPLRRLFKRKYTFDMIFASRGCPINCDFCSVSQIFGSKYRFRPIKQVIEEISHFRGYFYLIDDTVFGRPNTFDYYSDLYDELTKMPNTSFWIGQANLDAASFERGREVIRKAVKSGLVYTAIGLESINQDVLKKSGSFNKMGIKNENVVEKMKENIQYIQQQGILISGWFTVGYEDDTIDSYYETWKFCKEIHIMPVISPVHALKGTDLYKRLSESGQLVDLSENVTNIKNPNMSNQEVLDALKFVVRKGYSIRQIIKRTWYYFNILRKQKHNSVNDIIHKTIFALVTQFKMGSITRSENKRLQNKISKHAN